MRSINDHPPFNDCQALLELIPDYAFGLTDSDETRLVEENIALCPEAAAQLADYQAMQAEMRSSVVQIDPPAHVMDQLMTAIAEPAKPSRKPVPAAWWAVAAAVVTLIVTNLYWFNRVDDLSQQVNHPVTPAVTQQNAAFVAATISDIRWVRLPASQEGTDSSALLMWNAESKLGLLYVQDFPPLPEGQTYQLWFTRGEDRANAGTFHVDEEGKGVLVFEITRTIDEFTWSRITIETEEGGAVPSDSVVVNGEL